MKASQQHDLGGEGELRKDIKGHGQNIRSRGAVQKKRATILIGINEQNRKKWEITLGGTWGGVGCLLQPDKKRTNGRHKGDPKARGYPRTDLGAFTAMKGAET